MPKATSGNEGLRADEMVDGALTRTFRRMGDGRDRDVRSFGKILQRTELRADVCGLVAVDLAAHVSRYRVDGDQRDVTDLRHGPFENIEVFAEQKLAILAVGLNALQDMNAAEVRARGNQAGYDFLIEHVFRREHNDVAGRCSFFSIGPSQTSSDASDIIDLDLRLAEARYPR